MLTRILSEDILAKAEKKIDYFEPMNIYFEGPLI